MKTIFQGQRIPDHWWIRCKGVQTFSRRSMCSARNRPGISTIRKKWKLLGNHHGQEWYGIGNGKHHKRNLHKAERRMYRDYSSNFHGLSVKDAIVLYYSGHDLIDNSMKVYRSICHWRND